MIAPDLRRGLGLAAILVCVAPVGHAQSTWLALPEPKPGVTLLFDTSSVSTIGETTYGTFRWTGLYHGDSTTDGMKFAYAERGVVIRCASGMVSLEAILFYSKQDSILNSEIFEEKEWEPEFAPAPAGQPVDIEREALCLAVKQRAAKGLPPVRISGVHLILRPSNVAPGSHEVAVLPEYAGFRIGEPLRYAVPLLGPSPVTQTLGDGADAPVSYASAQRAVELLATHDEGVLAIFSTSRAAGTLDGIAVGDSRDAAVAKWGPPAAGSANAALWLATPFIISAKFDAKGRIIRLGMGQ